MKKTVLYNRHIALGAKMAPFGGFEMPIQYEGIVKEHLDTRQNATIFDTCHMGEFIVSGPTAMLDLEQLFTCSIASLKVGRCRNGFLCNEQGGVIDDLIVYRLQERDFMVVVNAATQDGDFEWIRDHLSTTTTIVNTSGQTAKIDLQGPRAPAVAASLVSGDISDMRYYDHRTLTWRGKPLFVSRTGYTGEIGFEFYLQDDIAGDFWDELIGAGAKPAGLGARDTLRLEMGFPLYGHELSAGRNAAEAGFSRIIAADKSFIGSTVVLNPGEIRQLLVSMIIPGRRAARAHDAIVDISGTTVGEVTSGSYSPCLECAIALGYVDKEHARPGTRLSIRTSRQDLPCTVSERPLYKNGTSRRPIRDFLESPDSVSQSP